MALRTAICTLALLLGTAKGRGLPDRAVTQEDLDTWKTRAGIYYTRLMAIKTITLGTSLYASTMPLEKYVDIKRAQMAEKQDSHHIHFRYIREMQRVIYMGLHVYFSGDTYEMYLRLSDEMDRLKKGMERFEKQRKAEEHIDRALTAGASSVALMAAVEEAAEATNDGESDPEDGTEMLDGERRLPGRAREGTAPRRARGMQSVALLRDVASSHPSDDEVDPKLDEEHQDGAHEKVEEEQEDEEHALERVEGQAAIRSGGKKQEKKMTKKKDSMMSHAGKTGSDHAGETHAHGHSPSFAKLHEIIKGLRVVMQFCAFFQSAVVNVEWSMQQKVMGALHHMVPQVESDPQASDAEKKAASAELRYHTAEVVKSNGFAMFEHAMAEQWNIVDVSMFQGDLPEEEILVPIYPYNPLNYFLRNPFGVYGGLWSNFRPQGQFQRWKAQLMARLRPPGGSSTAEALGETDTEDESPR